MSRKIIFCTTLFLFIFSIIPAIGQTPSEFKNLPLYIEKPDWLNLIDWKKPNIFKQIQEAGNISDEEMYKVFNMGIGMTFIVSKDDADDCVDKLNTHCYESTIIGAIKTKNTDSVVLV